jgi:hypothetical protein
MIIRREHNGNFTVVPNGVLNDEALSYDAVGLLCYLLSKPNNWTLQIEQLRHRGGVGRDKVYKLIGQLCDAGYIVKQQARDPETAAFVAHEYVVYDRPFPENPEVDISGCEDEPLPEKPYPEKPYPANQDHNKDRKTVSTELIPRSGKTGDCSGASTSKPKTRKRISYTPDFEAFWKAYPTTPNMPKAEAFKEWQRLDAADRQVATGSLPAYRRDLDKEDWRKPVYACRYLKQRRFEGFAQSVDVAKLDAMDWPKLCDLAIRTGQWPRIWGPAPGKPGCLVPADLATSQLVAAVQGRRVSA